MRSLLFALGLVFLAAPVDAAPFTPDRFSYEVTNEYFGSTLRDTRCLLCEDLITTNDILLDLMFPDQVGGFFYDSSHHEIPFSLAGAMEISGPGEDPIPVFADSVTVEILLSLWDSTAPDLISVTPGFFTGSIFGYPGFAPRFSCCVGIVNSVIFIHTRNPAIGFELHHGISYVGFEERHPLNPAFTPAAVPEPASLLLVGTGALGLLSRRRQRRALLAGRA